MWRAVIARLAGWLCLVIGVAFLAQAGVLVSRAVQQAGEISAYQHARACPAGAAPEADCLDRVRGLVAGVTEAPANFATRIPPVFGLNVRTGQTTLRMEFSSDSPMLSHALDGDPAVVTMWRGVPVDVATNGRSDATTSVPRTAGYGDLRSSGEAGCGGVIFILAAWAIRRKRTASTAQPPTSPLLALTRTAVLASPPDTRTVMRRPRTQVHPASWIRALDARFAASFLPMLLTAAVVFGGAVTTQDAAAARDLRHTPACAGETNLATCVGDFTAVINGVRAPVNGASGADVSFVVADGVINSWATFGGDAAPIAPLASAAEHAGTRLRVRVWRGSIIGADFGGGWHWANGNPPSYTIPATLLAVSFALLVLLIRLRIHRRSRPGADRQQLLADDLGQVSAAAGSVLLLVYGFWAGAILGLAVLAWLGLSARQILLSGRVTADTLHSS